MAGLKRLVFFGTPAFAVPTLDALAGAGRMPVCVVSQPPRPAGRGRDLRQPPVAAWALRNEIELLQPEKVRSEEFLVELDRRHPDLAVVVAFGQIFPRRLLEIPRHGCVNLHASLLPKHRGAAPVAAAIAAGDRLTGVSTMIMEAGLDSGPVLLQRETEIGELETAGELGVRLAALGAALVVETLDAMERGSVKPLPQCDAEATYAPRLEKEDGIADWTLEAHELFDRLRAFTPWPGMEAGLRARPLKIVWARPLSSLDPGPPGEILGTDGDGRLMVRCGRGTVLGVERVQRPGRTVVAARDFVNGERVAAGERFDTEGQGGG